MVVETMEVVLLRPLVLRPGRRLLPRKNDALFVVRGRMSDQTYQSRKNDLRSARACWNHGESTDVWLTTRSTMTRMPRPWRAA